MPVLAQAPRSSMQSSQASPLQRPWSVAGGAVAAQASPLQTPRSTCSPLQLSFDGLPWSSQKSPLQQQHRPEMQMQANAMPQQQKCLAPEGDPVDNSAWLSAEAQTQRRQLLGLSKPELSAFAQDCEFVSLGGFCGIARAFECVGLKRFSYPFDWVRSPMDGVIQCFETKFQEFLTHSVVFEQNNMKVYGKTKWGGSFWHHNPDDAKVKSQMTRRIERLLGTHPDVPASRTRVFVRAADSSTELKEYARLLEALRSALPEANVYLLLLVDYQKSSGPVGVAGDDHLLIWRVHESICPAADNWTMQRQAEGYAEALAFAVSFWAGEKSSASRVNLVADVAALCQACNDYDGSDPSCEMWLPKKSNQKPPQSSLGLTTPPSVCDPSTTQAAKDGYSSALLNSRNNRQGMPAQPLSVSYAAPTQPLSGSNVPPAQRLIGSYAPPAFGGAARYPMLLTNSHTPFGTMPVKTSSNRALQAQGSLCGGYPIGAAHPVLTKCY